MERRTFLNLSGVAGGTLLVPVFGRAVAAEAIAQTAPTPGRKALADTALSAATAAGASYCDVRIGRYLNQFITTRDARVEDIVNTESIGIGVRVVANHVCSRSISRNTLLPPTGPTSTRTSTDCGRR